MVTDTGGASTARSARRLNAPRPALVEAHADGTPRRVNRAGSRVLREEWRIVDRWWTEEPVDRRYFDVVLETGENAVVYRDGETGAWFTQRARERQRLDSWSGPAKLLAVRTRQVRRRPRYASCRTVGIGPRSGAWRSGAIRRAPAGRGVRPSSCTVPGGARDERARPGRCTAAVGEQELDLALEHVERRRRGRRAGAWPDLERRVDRDLARVRASAARVEDR